MKTASKTIAESVVNDPDFSILVQALIKADLTAEQLTPILLYHVVSGNVRSADLSEGSVETLNGTIEISLMPSPSINGSSMIVDTDVQATNGVVHVIDKVLFPPAR